MFRGNGERWTFDEDRRLLELSKGDEPAAFIAKVLGRTASAIRARQTALKIKSRTTELRMPWTTDEDEQLKELKEGGATWQEIADEIGRPQGGIKNRWIILQRRQAE